MKLDALDHPKTFDLAARLKVDLPTAIGYLELLWAFTAKKAPQGNVGKWTDASISSACFFRGEPGVFMTALVQSGFVDADKAHRYLIHDWREHAPAWLVAKLRKLKIDFVSPVPTQIVLSAFSEPSTREGKGSEEKGSEANETTPAGLRPAPALPDCPKNEIVSLYHEILPKAPRVEKWTDTRARLLRARWREHPSIDLWRQYFSLVKASNFLTGKTNGHGDRPPFVADLEWLIKPSNFAKVLEGRYDNRR